jgi:hypothetical protein
MTAGYRMSLPVEFFDCVILTQVLQSLSREGAVGNVCTSIAPGGTLLLTVPLLGRLDPHNVLTCVAALWGLSVQDLSAEELHITDPRFPLVARAHAEKPA